MRSKLMILALVLFTLSLTTSALAQDPIAHYPLLSNAADATGLHSDMVLENCPFYGFGQGVYCNGVYGDFTCQTPVMADMSRQTLTFTAEFKIENYHANIMPVIYLGRSWRTLGFMIDPEGYGGLATGNGSSTFLPSTTIVTLDEWHTARISWNGEMQIATCYLDGELIMIGEREAISESVDMRITTNNYANGDCFEGLFRNLKIYNTDEPQMVATEESSWGSVKSLYR